MEMDHELDAVVEGWAKINASAATVIIISQQHIRIIFDLF